MRSGLMLAAALLLVAPALAQFPEDFENGVPPTGWQALDLLPGTPFNWTTNVEPNETGGTGVCAEANSDYYGEAAFDLALITPEFAVPAGGLFVYDTAYENYLNLDVADVDITVDGGANWINLVHWNEDHSGPVHMEVDISAYAGQMAEVRFHFFDHDPAAWDWYWQVDNVNVVPEPSALALLALGGLALLRRR